MTSQSSKSNYFGFAIGLKKQKNQENSFLFLQYPEEIFQLINLVGRFELVLIVAPFLKIYQNRFLQICDSCAF